jgi:predicted enzyme related to lactoylglutathione lyase
MFGNHHARAGRPAGVGARDGVATDAESPIIVARPKPGNRRARQEMGLGFSFLEDTGMLNLNSILVGSTQPSVMAEFYQKVFARPADMAEEDGYGWMIGNTFFTVLEHSEMEGKSKDPGRVMVNFETEQVQEEFERIKALGATVIKAPYEMVGMWIATFADPDGNYFQLMSPFPSDGSLGQ